MKKLLFLLIPLIVIAGGFRSGGYRMDSTYPEDFTFEKSVTADSLHADHIVSDEQVDGDSIHGEHIVSAGQVDGDSLHGEHIVSAGQVDGDSLHGNHIVSDGQVSADSVEADHVVGTVHVATDSIDAQHGVFDTSLQGDSANVNHLIVNDVSTFGETMTYSNSTADADTGLYIKHYGSRTTDYGIVVDMDTSANTAANAIGIDFSGSNTIDDGSDYYLYLNANNNWGGSGLLKCISLYNNYFYSRADDDFAFINKYDKDFLFVWEATDKGGFIFRDGNLDATNVDFFQIQDSAGTAMLNIPNAGIRGQASFTRNVLVDTVPGVLGVSTNSFIFLTAKKATALTCGLTWTYLNTDSILIHVLAADTAGAALTYNWLRLE